MPFEFVFTKTIALPEWISKIISVAYLSLFNIAGVKVSLWTCLQVVWFVGIVISFIKYVKHCQYVNYTILAHSLDISDDMHYQAILTRVCQERRRKNSFKIYRVSCISSPMLYGFIKPRILIPNNLQLSDEELYFTFAHETAHYFHRDIWIKNIVKIISIVYWWNPLCNTLVHQTGAILEMRVDDTITSDDKSTLAYLKCLLYLRQIGADKSESQDTLSIGFVTLDETVLTKRFEMLINARNKKNRFLTITLSILATVLLLTSYLFIFEVHYIPSEVQETTNSITTASGYAVLKEDGTYDVYYGDIFLENTDSLEYYSSDIPIYTEKEIANEKQ